MWFSMTGLLVYWCLSSNIYIALTDIVPLHCLQSMPAGAMMSNSWRLLVVVSKCIKPLIRAHMGGQWKVFFFSVCSCSTASRICHGWFVEASTTVYYRVKSAAVRTTLKTTLKLGYEIDIVSVFGVIAGVVTWLKYPCIQELTRYLLLVAIPSPSLFATVNGIDCCSLQHNWW